MDISGTIDAIHATRTWGEISRGTGIAHATLRRYHGGGLPPRPDDVDTKLRAYARREGIALNGHTPPPPDEPKAPIDLPGLVGGGAAPTDNGAIETRSEAERRKAVAQADIVEMQAAQISKELISAATVQEALHQSGVVARRVFDTLVREIHAAVTEKDVARAIVERARADLLEGQARAFGG